MFAEIQQNIDQLSDDQDDEEFTFFSRQRPRRFNTNNLAEFPNIGSTGLENSDDDETSSTETDTSQIRNELDNNAISEIFENYSPPYYEPSQDPIDSESISDTPYLWILLWIMSFRKRFNILKTATESLIKFMKLLLTEIGGPDYDEFPNSLYMARSIMGLRDHFQTFVTYTKCHKLYKKQEVENFQQGETLAIMKCRHIQFPNSSARRSHFCENPLSRQATLLNRITNIPELIYPFAGI